MSNRSGVATVPVVVVIFIMGIIAGGISYFLGSQNATYQNETQPVVVEDTDKAAEEEIEKDIEDATLDSIDTDLQDIDKDAAQI